MKAKMILPGLLAIVIFTCSFSKSMAQENEKKKVFEKVEVMPKFEGKDIKHFRNWVMTNVQYPKEALKDGISGKVFASFTIGSDGSVKDLKIKKSAHQLLDDEVIKVIKKSPKWSPGLNKGEAVDVSITIPVDFKLS